VRGCNEQLRRTLKQYQNAADDVRRADFRQLIQYNADYGQLVGSVRDLSQLQEQVVQNTARLTQVLHTQTNPDITRWKDWDAENITKWLATIEDGKFRPYMESFLNEAKRQSFTGEYLPTLDVRILRDFGIENYGDRLLLVEAIEKLTNTPGNDDNIIVEGVQEPEGSSQ